MTFAQTIYQIIEELLAQKFHQAWKALPNKSDFQTAHTLTLNVLLEQDEFKLFLSRLTTVDDTYSCATCIAKEIVYEYTNLDDFSITDTQIQDGFAKYNQNHPPAASLNSVSPLAAAQSPSTSTATNSNTPIQPSLMSYPHETHILSSFTQGANAQMTIGNITHTQHIYIPAPNTIPQDR